jgi:hypothetical protein
MKNINWRIKEEREINSSGYNRKKNIKYFIDNIKWHIIWHKFFLKVTYITDEVFVLTNIDSIGQFTRNNYIWDNSKLSENKEYCPIHFKISSQSCTSLILLLVLFIILFFYYKKKNARVLFRSIISFVKLQVINYLTQWYH